MNIDTQAVLQKTLKHVVKAARSSDKIRRTVIYSPRFESLLDALLHHKNERPRKRRSKNRSQREQRIKAKLKRVTFLYRKELLSGALFLFRPRIATALTVAISSLSYLEFFQTNTDRRKA